MICPRDLLAESWNGPRTPRPLENSRVSVLLLLNVAFCKAIVEITDPAFWVDVVAAEVIWVNVGTVKLMPALLQKVSAKSTVSALKVRYHCAMPGIGRTL